MKAALWNKTNVYVLDATDVMKGWERRSVGYHKGRSIAYCLPVPPKAIPTHPSALAWFLYTAKGCPDHSIVPCLPACFSDCPEGR